MVDNMRYVGFLSAKALLRIINEKNLALARDQNPLTRLPGNTRIYEFVSQALASRTDASVLIYFDFDNFKPFNDTYGFRAGDRAIQLFADLLQREMRREDQFVGHIGGDDFFVGVRNGDLSSACTLATSVATRFAEDVRSLYDATDRDRGYIFAKGRRGRRHRFPLLSVSAAVLAITQSAEHGSMDSVLSAISTLKKVAKDSRGRIAAAILMPGGTVQTFDVSNAGGTRESEAGSPVAPFSWRPARV